VQAGVGTYFTRGSAATLNSSGHQPVAYALPVARGHYALVGPATVALTYTPAGASPSVPQRLWPGFLTSTRAQIAIWPPADGSVPDGYNAYQSGVKFNTSLIVPRQPQGAGIFYNFVSNLGMTPSTAYSFTARAVVAGIESADSVSLPITTLSGNTTPPTKPTPPTVPETFIAPYALPTLVTTATKTVWLATNNAAAANQGPLTGAGTDNGVAGNHKLSVGCSFSYALGNAIAGDVIVLTAGATYTSNLVGSSVYTFNTGAIGSSSGSIYVISSEDPAFKPGGLLPWYSYVPSRYYTSYATAAAATVAPGATSLTLSAPFLGRSGWYTTKFASTVASGIETRQALYQTRSTSVVWNVGLLGTGSSAFLVDVGNNVTPWDAGVAIAGGNVNPSPSMPTVRFSQNGGGGNGGNGLSITGTNLRFVGINIQPIASWLNQAQNLQACVNLGGTGNMLDRCIIGRDNTDLATLSFFIRAISLNGTNNVVHQCYIYGADAGNGSSQDASGISILSGGPFCIQNSYVDAGDENVISGGTFVPQNVMQHDMTIRYNTSHKPTAWQQVLVTANATTLSISRRIKNHFECKVAQRFEWYGNIIQNNALLTSSQGQGGRAFVLTPRDQWSLTEVRQIVSATWNSGTVTVNTTFNHGVAGPLFTTTIKNCPIAGYNGTFLCTVTGPSSFTYSVAGPLAAAGTFTGYESPDLSGGMWMDIADGHIHDNQVYDVGEGHYCYSGADYCPVLYSARLWIHNNLFKLNPAMTDDANLQTPIRAMEFQGFVSDVYLHNNTYISRPQGTGYSVGTSALGLTSVQGGTTNTLNDRWVVTNNIIDCNPGGKMVTPGGTTNPPNINAVGGPWVRACWDTTTQTTGTLTWDRNLFVLDASSGANAWPATTYQVLGAYGSIGFANFVSNTTTPASPSDWNVVSGPYLTAGTDGGPLGAQFGGPALATDQFPRLRLQVIAPSGSTYANAGFQSSAGIFNLVDFGPYMGIEQTQGATFATIFAAIKTAGKANGILTRCLHYTMSSELAKSGGSGNSNTYTQWIASVNSANWWLRTAPYPSGAIVASSDGQTNTGTLQTSSQNTVTLGGLTFAQAYWAHYDGVLRQGNAVAQGYASGVAFAPNPYLDGYQMDNIFDQPRVSGAWGNDTTQYTSHWGTSADSTISAWIQQGAAAQIAALRAINPRMLILGNADYFIRSTTNFSYQVALDPSLRGTMDAVYCQNVIGVGGIEGQGVTTTAQLMANLRAAEALMAPGGTLIFEQNGPSHGASWSNVNQASWTNADWQAARFGMACACMGGLNDWHYALSRSDGTYTPTTIYLMDEFGVTTGGSQTNGRNWLGAPLEQQQVAPRTVGVWYRVFGGGVVFMNPKGNGSQTITLATIGLAGMKAISNIGFGVGSINTGLAVSSITLSDRDGRFLTF
jgi:hypothetical protein